MSGGVRLSAVADGNVGPTRTSLSRFLTEVPPGGCQRFRLLRNRVPADPIKKRLSLSKSLSGVRPTARRPQPAIAHNRTLSGSRIESASSALLGFLTVEGYSAPIWRSSFSASAEAAGVLVSPRAWRKYLLASSRFPFWAMIWPILNAVHEFLGSSAEAFW